MRNSSKKATCKFGIMKKILRYAFATITLMFFCIGNTSAQTAETLLRKSAAAIKSANGLSASFTMMSGKEKVSGTLKSSGHRFSIESSASSTWYDGKTMWTYNARTNETSVTIPTPAELAESNPLYIVDSYSGNFTPSFAKTQAKGSKTIVLTPKNRKTGYQSVHLTIPDGSSFPSNIVILPKSGQRITISITQVKIGQKFAPTVFSYPKSQYPKAEIVDLR